MSGKIHLAIDRAHQRYGIPAKLNPLLTVSKSPKDLFSVYLLMSYLSLLLRRGKISTGISLQENQPSSRASSTRCMGPASDRCVLAQSAILPNTNK